MKSSNTLETLKDNREKLRMLMPNKQRNIFYSNEDLKDLREEYTQIENELGINLEAQEIYHYNQNNVITFGYSNMDYKEDNLPKNGLNFVGITLHSYAKSQTSKPKKTLLYSILLPLETFKKGFEEFILNFHNHNNNSNETILTKLNSAFNKYQITMPQDKEMIGMCNSLMKEYHLILNDITNIKQLEQKNLKEFEEKETYYIQKEKEIHNNLKIQELEDTIKKLQNELKQKKNQMEAQLKPYKEEMNQFHNLWHQTSVQLINLKHNFKKILSNITIKFPFKVIDKTNYQTYINIMNNDNITSCLDEDKKNKSKTKVDKILN